MARQSAKSKGYRRQVEKKPYLSRRDIVILCVAAVAVVVAAFFLFRMDDGALKVREGKVMTDGDNWLIVNGSNARGGVRYFKIGEIGEIDGYSRTAQSLSTDDNIPEYQYSPATDGDPINQITVTTSHTPAEALAKYARTALGDVEGNEMGELQSAELGGRPVSYYVYTTERAQGDVTNNSAQASPDDAAEETASPAKGESVQKGASAEKGGDTPAEANRFMKSLAGYADAAHDSSVVIHITGYADTAESLPPDEALLGVLERALGAVQLTEK